MSIFHEINPDKFSPEKEKPWYKKINVFESLWRKVWGLTPLYWLRSHTFTRYHILDLRHEDYQWGWCDKTHLMLNACFNLLVDFVEKEKPFKYIDWSTTEEHAHAAQEIQELYTWWTKGRKEEHEFVSHLTDGVNLRPKFIELPNGHFEWDSSNYASDPRFLLYCEKTDELEEKDDWMLARLIAIRRYLWT